MIGATVMLAEWHDEGVGALAEAAEAMRVGNPLDLATEVGAVNSAPQLEANLGAVNAPEFTDDELAQIDQHAVDAGINLWSTSSDA